MRTWRTDRMTMLDRPESISTAARALNGRLPGTGQPYDAQKAANEILQMVSAETQDQQGAVHIETALTTLGALAGFAVQMALRETLVKPGKMPEDKVFVIARTTTGESFYFGDLLNQGLFGGQPGVFSVYGLIAGGAQTAGAKKLPDINDITGYIANTIGTEKFGIPRVPAEHMPHQAPVELLNRFWNPIRNYMVLNVQAPLQWPLVLALAAQKGIVAGKAALDPGLAATLTIETAAAMAKIAPAKIHSAYFQAD